MDTDVAAEGNSALEPTELIQPAPTTAGTAAAPSRLIWTVTTAIPGVNVLPWLWLARRTRSIEYAVSGVLAFLFPVVALVIAGCIAAVAEIKPNDPRGLALWGAMTVMMWIISLIAAQRTWHALRKDTEESAHSPSLSAYFCGVGLWMTFGWIGGHRFYAGRWVSGTLYLCTFGLLGLGWAADFLLLPRLLSQPRRREQPAPAVEDRSEPELPQRSAEWVEQDSLFSRFDHLLRIGYFVVGPLFFVTLGMMIKQYELLVVMAVVIVLCGMLDNLERVAAHLAVLARVPVLGQALTVFQRFHEFYLQYRPRSFAYYLCYPISAFIAARRSPQARKELGLFLGVLKPVLVVVALQQIVTYPAVYPPHLTLEDALVRVISIGVLTIIMAAAFLAPMVSTSFKLKLSGRHLELRALSVVTLMIAVPLSGYCFYQQATEVSYLGFELLTERLEKASFREELGEASEMFLGYHIDRTSADDPRGGLRIDERLTEKYRRQVAGLAAGDEPNAFEVFAIDASDAAPGERWLGVRIRDGFLDDPAQMLFVMSPRRQLHTEWRTLPPEIQRHFQIVGELPEGGSRQPQFIAAETLLGDRL